jgi:hypothetical protein
MKMERHWTERLSEYLDGELPAKEVPALEAHLSTCGECSNTLADLRSVRDRARTLETPAAPAGLWPGILARIEAEQEPRPLVVVPRVPRWFERRLSFSLPQALAASVALVLLTGAVVWGILKSPQAPAPRAESPIAQGPSRTSQPVAPSTGAPAETAPPAAQPMVAELSERPAPSRDREPASARTRTPSPNDPNAAVMASFDPRLDATITELQNVLAHERARLDTSTVRILEQNLAIIDRAVEEARRAVLADPGNPYLRSHLASTMRRKVDLLRRATVIASARG